jgi:hypothetical protein
MVEQLLPDTHEEIHTRALVVDSMRVTILDCIPNLDEHAFDQLIFSEECELPDDGMKIRGHR